MDQEEFLKILENHKGILYKVANSYVNSWEDQQDLIQEMTLQVYRSADKFNPRFQWSTFIYRIALNVAISYYRKQRKTKLHRDISESILQIPDPHEMEKPGSERFEILRGLLDELKPLDKALMLLYLDETNSAQIAEIMGISQTNVTSKIHRIKKTLKKKLEPYK